MPTQGQRQDYLWRPNDNSATTRLRYDLEAEHWLKSLTGTLEKGQRNIPNFSGTFQVIGVLISLILNLIFIILLSVSKLLSWLLNITKSDPSTKVVRREVPLTYAELKSRRDNGKLKVVDIYEN